MPLDVAQTNLNHMTLHHMTKNKNVRYTLLRPISFYHVLCFYPFRDLRTLLTRILMETPCFNEHKRQEKLSLIQIRILYRYCLALLNVLSTHFILKQLP